MEEVKKGNISAEDFVSATIDRIKNVDDKLHAFLQVNSKAIEQASQIDKKSNLVKKLVHVLECQFQLKTIFV